MAARAQRETPNKQYPNNFQTFRFNPSNAHRLHSVTLNSQYHTLNTFSDQFSDWFARFDDLYAIGDMMREYGGCPRITETCGEAFRREARLRALAGGLK